MIAGTAASAEAPALLPPETLLMVSVREPARLLDLLNQSGPAKLWADPAMRRFVDKLSSRWREEFRDPFQRELGFSPGDFTKLARGHLTLAMVRRDTSGEGTGGAGVGWLCLMEVGDQSAQLRTNLEALSRKWTEAGRQIRSEEIRGAQFLVMPASTNGLPKSLQQFLPRALEYRELGEEPAPASRAGNHEWFLGHSGSVLILADGRQLAEQAVARISGGALPNLAEQATFAAEHAGLFRDAPLYAWLNAEPFFGALARQSAGRKENPDAPSPVEEMRLDKLFGAAGLLDIRSIAFAAKAAEPGLMLECHVAAPDSKRRGLVKIIGGLPKETAAPAFVPADVVQFRRWRVDGQQAWASLEKMLSEVSPQAANVINFIFDTANMAAREKSPGFDVRKNLIGNLGDDLVMFRKAAALPGPSGLGPQLFLLGSPSAEELAGAMRSVLVFVAAQAGAPEEREFLGRKIYSVTLPSVPLFLPGTSSPVPVPRRLHYAAGGGYVAFSTDAGLVEEYLRNAEAAGKPLRQVPGLAEAFEKVATPATSMFAYNDHARSFRATYENLRSARLQPGPTNQVDLLPAVPGMKPPERRWQDLADFSLLPPFEAVEKYFGYSVSCLTATSERLSYRVYFPPPRQEP